MHRLSIFTAAFVGLAVPAIGQAAVVQTNALNTTSPVGFTASDSDLVNAGQSSLAGVTATNDPSNFKGPANDGSVGADDAGVAGTDYFGYDGSPQPTITFHLDTSINTAGYDISAIDTYTSGTGYRVNQTFQVLYTTVSNATPVDLGIFEYAPTNDTTAYYAASSIHVNLTDDTGVIASGVNSITFVLYNDANTPSVGSRWREFDVTGTPVVVPEPAGLGLLGAATLMALTRRRSHG